MYVVLENVIVGTICWERNSAAIYIVANCFGYVTNLTAKKEKTNLTPHVESERLCINGTPSGS